MKVQVKVRPRKSGKTSHRKEEEKGGGKEEFQGMDKIAGEKIKKKNREDKEFKDWQSENTI